MHSKAFILEVENLKVLSGEQELLKGISFRLKAGEITALVGQTGAGKSLTAWSIIGLVREAGLSVSGKIIYKGRDILSLTLPQMNALRRNEIALMLQNPLAGFNPVITVGKQLLETVLLDKSLDKKEAKQRVMTIIREAGLNDPERFYRAWPSELSGGELQRLMFALSIAGRPQLLILDEPTASLDPSLRAYIIRLVAEKVRNTGMSVLVISHDLRHVAPIADHILVLQNGHIVDRGTFSYLQKHSGVNITRALFEAMLPQGTSKGNRYEMVGYREEYAIPVLHVKNLKVGHYDAKGVLHPVIRDQNLKLYPGQCIGVTGPSGSGKSTLALGLARLADSIQGEIVLEGKDLLQLEGKALRVHRRKIQMIWQNPMAALHPRHTIRRALKEALVRQAPEGIPMTISSVLASVHLPDEILDKRPHQLSGGQQQRVSIAIALAIKPRVLICDEPVSALDAITQMKILDLLKTLQRQYKLAILFISHDESSVQYMAENIMQLKG